MLTRERQRLIVRVGLLALFLVAIFIAAQYLAQNDILVSLVSRFGYPGLFIASAFSGFNFLVPVPIILFLSIFLEAGLSFWLTLIIMSIGMTVGDSVGYLIGGTGRVVAEKVTEGRDPEENAPHRVMAFIESFRTKHAILPYVILLIYVTAAPAPNELLVMPMAFAGYPYKKMFPIILVGNFLFNVAIAYGTTTLLTAFF